MCSHDVKQTTLYICIIIYLLSTEISMCQFIHCHANEATADKFVISLPLLCSRLASKSAKNCFEVYLIEIITLILFSQAKYTLLMDSFFAYGQNKIVYKYFGFSFLFGINPLIHATGYMLCYKNHSFIIIWCFNLLPQLLFRQVHKRVCQIVNLSWLKLALNQTLSSEKNACIKELKLFLICNSCNKNRFNRFRQNHFGRTKE